MRYQFVVAAIAAGCLLAYAPVRAAEPAHDAGGPVQEGGKCWVSTQSDLGFGYWDACPGKPHVTKTMHKSKS